MPQVGLVVYFTVVTLLLHASYGLAGSQFVFLELLASDSPHHVQAKYIGLPARYGKTLSSGESIKLPLVAAPGAEQLACSPFSASGGGGGVDYDDTAVLVSRGECTFINKTLHVYEAGARAAIVFNDRKRDVVRVIRGTPPPGVDEFKSVYTVSVSKRTGEKLSEHVSGTRTLQLRGYDRPLVDASVIPIFVIAVATVFAGAYFSSKKERAQATGRLDTVDLRDEPVAIAYLDERSAYAFVLVASVALVVLFFFINKLIYLLIGVFCLGGIQGLHALCMPTARRCAPVRLLREVRIPCCGHFSKLALLVLIPCVAFALWWVIERHSSYAWILQDLMAISLLLLVQRTLRLPSIKVSTILLVLAFFYDIFWVFISPYIFSSSVMVTVATGGDSGEPVPLLIRIPRINDELGGYAMLGLGDVALPGLLISFLLRFDYQHQLFGRKGYFMLSVIGYAIGLLITDLALVLSGAAQPALLYLVPCTLGLTVYVARKRNHLQEMWHGPQAPDGSLLPDANVGHAYAEIDSSLADLGDDDDGVDSRVFTIEVDPLDDNELDDLDYDLDDDDSDDDE